MSKNNSVLLYCCLVFILLFTRVALAQQNEMGEDLNPAEQTESALQVNPTQTDSSPITKPNEQVIAHQDIKNNELSLNELRAIFSLRARKWPDGSPITVFVLRDENEAHRQFLLKTLKMLPHQLRRQWDRFIYSGIGQGPTVVDSQEEMLSKVKITPGSIGYYEGGVPDGKVHMLSIR